MPTRSVDRHRRRAVGIDEVERIESVELADYGQEWIEKGAGIALAVRLGRVKALAARAAVLTLAA